MDAQERGFTLYKKGMKYKEISEKIGVPLNTVKSWAARYWKPKQDAAKKRNQKLQPKKVATKVSRKMPKGGAPKGNVNAVGAGAPIKNQNAVKHGGCVSLWADSLTDKEKAVIQTAADFDAEAALLEEIALLSIREARILSRIQEYSNKAMVVQSVFTGTDKREFKRLDGDAEQEQRDKSEYIRRQDDKVAAGEILPGKDVRINTNTEAGYQIVHRLEQILTDVQKQKSKAVQQLVEIRKINGSGKNDAVNDWIAAVCGEPVDAEEGGEDNAEE